MISRVIVHWKFVVFHKNVHVRVSDDLGMGFGSQGACSEAEFPFGKQHNQRFIWKQGRRSIFLFVFERCKTLRNFKRQSFKNQSCAGCNLIQARLMFCHALVFRARPENSIWVLVPFGQGETEKCKRKHEEAAGRAA